MSAILDWIDQIRQDREAAADPTDTGPRAEIVRSACDWAASKGGFISGAPWVQSTCRPYWDGDPGYPPPGAPAPPFTGGQCEVTYRLRNITIDSSGNPTTPNGVAVPGPVTGVRVNGSESVPITGFPNRTQFSITWLGPNFGGLNQSPISFENSISFEVARDDGQPDDCGDPEDVQPEPVNVPDLPPDGEPIDVSPPGWTGPPITITFPPDVPDEPSYGPIETPFGPGDVFGPANQPPESGPGSDPLPPSEGDDVAGGEPSGEDEDPTLENVIGYSWEFPSIPGDRGGVAGKSPATFFEALGTIQLTLQDPDGGRYYGGQYVIREARGSIMRDDPTVSVVGVSWAVKPSFGVVQIRPLVAEES